MKLIFEKSGKDILVSTRKDFLGRIHYYPKWKCHVWEQCSDIVMSSKCLMQIIEKLKEFDGGKLK